MTLLDICLHERWIVEENVNKRHHCGMRLKHDFGKFEITTCQVPHTILTRRDNTSMYYETNSGTTRVCKLSSWCMTSGNRASLSIHNPMKFQTRPTKPLSRKRTAQKIEMAADQWKSELGKTSRCCMTIGLNGSLNGIMNGKRFIPLSVIGWTQNKIAF